MKLYHGILSKNKQSMLKNGVRGSSYWGSKGLALQYSDCNEIIEIDSQDYSISPNETIIEHYAVNDPGDENYNLWLSTNQQWEDSFNCFDSVIIEDDVYFTENQIIKE